MASDIKTRDQIDPKYLWDLSSMYPDDGAFLAALEDARRFPGELAAFAGRLAESPQVLLDYLRLEDQAGMVFGKLGNYAERRSDEDTRDSTYQDYSSQVTTLAVAVASACAWFIPELLSLGQETIDAYYAACPELEVYRRALDVLLRRREHTLSPAEEALLASARDMAAQPENVYSLLSDADLTFSDAVDSAGREHPVTHGGFIPLMLSQDRVLRESAFKSMYASYGQFRNTVAATLGAQVKQLQFFSDARKYPSALAYALDSTEVPVEVYHNLIAAVHEGMGAMYSYVDLRKRLLGVDELHFWDLYVPVVDDVDMHFTYEEACELVLEALAPLGEDYLDIVRRGFAERWVDVYETPGKRSGAYSAGGYGMHPVVLLNFQGTLDDVFTLAHEMGHSVHTYLSCANQSARYSDYVIFVAEVASTCNESLLMQHLLKKTTDSREKAYLVNHFLEQFRTTLYRQCMFAEFELKVGELAATGAGVTADALCSMYRELNREYFGPGIVLDDEIALEWARIPHFYYEYYVYQYATGFSAAIALSNRILTEGAPAVADYLAFLSGGCSKTPIDLLRGAGVDMATPEPVADALRFFGQLVDTLSELVG